MSDNYLYYDYAKSAVCHIKEKSSFYTTASSIDHYFDQECLQHGSTLKGRKRAFSLLMDQKRFLPVVIQLQPEKIYFPIKSKSAPDNIWVCFESIDHIEYKKKTCKIYFKDHTCLICQHPSRIYRSIHQIYRFLKLQKVDYE